MVVKTYKQPRLTEADHKAATPHIEDVLRPVGDDYGWSIRTTFGFPMDPDRDLVSGVFLRAYPAGKVPPARRDGSMPKPLAMARWRWDEDRLPEADNPPEAFAAIVRQLRDKIIAELTHKAFRINPDPGPHGAD